MIDNDNISREAAIAAIKSVPSGNWSSKRYINEIKNIPAADVRPVVLCRECKYAPSGTDSGEDQGFGLEWPHDEWPEDNPCPCKCADGWYSHKPTPDFFCAAGEKREKTNAE